jgi:single-strand DNA-binding protein
MAGIALAQIVGNLGGEPETRVTPNGKTNVGFSVAVNSKRGGEERTTWFRVTAWGQLAEVLTDLAQRGAFAKGSQVFVSGRIEAREYQDKNGATRTSLDVNASEVQLVGGRPVSGGALPGDEDRGGGGGGYQDVDDIPF